VFPVSHSSTGLPQQKSSWSFVADLSCSDFGDVVWLRCTDRSKGSRGEAPLRGADSVAVGWAGLGSAVPTGRNGEKLLEGGVGRFTDSSFVVEKVRYASRSEQYFC
jgi:hypothetical protein